MNKPKNEEIIGTVEQDMSIAEAKDLGISHEIVMELKEEND